jgi:hypothetical protein
VGGLVVFREARVYVQLRHSSNVYHNLPVVPKELLEEWTDTLQGLGELDGGRLGR